MSRVAVVVNTHLHFDHCGGNRLFPGVPIHVQRRELADARTEEDYTVREWVDFDGATYVEHDGEAEILPGVRLVPAPGHTRGAPGRGRGDGRGAGRARRRRRLLVRGARARRHAGEAARPRARRADVARARRRAARAEAPRVSRYSIGREPLGERVQHLRLDRRTSRSSAGSAGGDDEDARGSRRDGRGARPPVTSAISPRKSPRTELLTLRPLRRTSASPSTSTTNSLPVAPSFVRSRPAGRSSSSASARDLAELALRAALEERHPLQQLDLGVLAQHRPRYSRLHVP